MSDDDERLEVKQPEPLGVPGWVVTFGDMMSLLLCFFILLFILSKNEEEKYKSVIGSIQNAFGVNNSNPTSPFASHSMSPDQQGTASLGRAEREVMETVQESIMASQNSTALQQSMIVDIENRGVVLRLYSSDIFEPGTAKLKPGVEVFFEPVVAAINRHQFDVLVRANVTMQALNPDNLPQPHYTNVWELSAARAASVLQGLITYGNIKPSRLKAMGTGDTDLRVPLSDPKSEHYNNRTEFIFYLPGTEFW